MGSWLAFVRRTPCLTLLVVQLSSVVIYPFLGGESSYAGRTVFASLGILALLLVIRAVRATPWFSWFSGLVFVPALLLLAASIVTGEPVLIPISAAFEAVLYVYAGIALLAYMLHDSRRHHRRAVRDPRGLHPLCLGVRLPLRRRPGARPRRLRT